MMIRLIEALNFRCLRYLSQPLPRFHILVGPNASGKSTFLDVAAFLGQMVSDGLEPAIAERTSNFSDLIFGRSGNKFELAVEIEIPEDRRRLLEKPTLDTIRYEVQIGLEEESDSGPAALLAEKVLLINRTAKKRPRSAQRALFPMTINPPNSILFPKGEKDTKTIINKVRSGNDNFYDETGKKWDHSFKLGPYKSALANLPDDESKFPVSTWLKKALQDGVQKLILNGQLMRLPSPPGQREGFRTDGSNLPWVVKWLKEKANQNFRQWIEHLRTALDDLIDIKTLIRAEDRHCYLVIRYKNDLEVPSWLVSDGTLRLLALTLPAYLQGMKSPVSSSRRPLAAPAPFAPELQGVYLVEEPENGIHPQALESVFQSLSSLYEAQALMATHSPVLLSLAEPKQVLCFSKTEEGAADIVSGANHPKLKQWKGEPNLSVLFFAGGVLG